MVMICIEDKSKEGHYKNNLKKKVMRNQGEIYS